MSSVTGYGIIGCGMMGHEHMHNIALLPDAQVVAIFEPDAEMAAGALAIEPRAQLCRSVAEVVQHPDVDALVIVSPNHLHVEQLHEIAALRHVPILVEKPLLTDPADIAKMTAFEQSYRAPVWVAMEYRYMPPIAAFVQEAQEATGGIVQFTLREHRFPFLHKVGDWNRFNHKTGGTFVEKCCHFFDLMRFTLGSEPSYVMAMGGQDVNHLDEEYAGQTPDILDNGYVIVGFENGTRAMLELCMFAEGARYQEELSATGPQGKIEAQVPGPGRFWPDHLGAPPVPTLTISPRQPKGPVIRDIPVDPALLAAGDHNGATFYQHQKFLELVRGTLAAPEVSLNDGKIAVMMGMAAQRSIEEKRAVFMYEMLSV